MWISTHHKVLRSASSAQRQSGREKGIQGLKAWMQQKSIYLATGNSVNHWCD